MEKKKTYIEFINDVLSEMSEELSEISLNRDDIEKLVSEGDDDTTVSINMADLFDDSEEEIERKIARDAKKIANALGLLPKEAKALERRLLQTALKHKDDEKSKYDLQKDADKAAKELEREVKKAERDHQKSSERLKAIAKRDDLTPDEKKELADKLRDEDEELDESINLLEMSDDEWSVFLQDVLDEKVITKRVIRNGRSVLVRKSDKKGYKIDPKTGREVRMSAAERKKRSDAAKRVNKRPGIKKRRLKKFKKSIETKRKSKK